MADSIPVSLAPPSPMLLPAIEVEGDPRSIWRQAKLGDIRNGVSDSVGEIVSDLLDVDQCLRVILTTPKGTDPYRPDFALDVLDYLDWPIQKATPIVAREAMRAIATWEPRVELLRVGIRPDAAIARSYLQVEWRLKDPPQSAQAQLTEVLFGAFV
jgi:uncharacterized protein